MELMRRQSLPMASRSRAPARTESAGDPQGVGRSVNKHFEIDELPGLNHLFQTAKTGAPAEYAQIEETKSPVALEKISSWILKQWFSEDCPLVERLPRRRKGVLLSTAGTENAEDIRQLSLR